MNQAWEKNIRQGSLSELRHALATMLKNLSDDQISEIAGIDFKIRQGPGQLVLPSGEKYEGEWKMGKKHGFGKLVNAKGEIYHG